VFLKTLLCCDRLSIFIFDIQIINKKLNEKGIKTEHKAQPVNAEFIESKDYDGIINRERNNNRNKNGSDINAFIENAKKKHEKIAEGEKNVQFSKEDQKLSRVFNSSFYVIIPFQIIF
jgi:hypothetical protein